MAEPVCTAAARSVDPQFEVNRLTAGPVVV